MMSFGRIVVLCAAGALAACQPAIPDSAAGVVDTGRGVGFDSPTTLAARQARDAASAPSTSAPGVPAAPTVAAQPLPRAAPTATASAAVQTSSAPAAAAQPMARAVSDPQGLDAELAQIARQNDAAAARQNSGQEVIVASPSNAAPVLLNNPGISDENDFGAVSSRQSIESDAARIAANRQQYQVVQPTALPARSGAGAPNVVQYALQTTHPRGTRVYNRFGLNAQAKFDRNCALYSSTDEAQIDFLAQGGPQRDRKGLDPDGDGYACGWDPTPFRRAANG